MASEIKPICGLDRVKLSEVIPLSTPFTLFIFPTTFCNFKCNYCGHSLGMKEMKERYGFKPQNMSMVTLKVLIEQAKQFPEKFKMISLTGHGEPLMNKELSSMVELVRKANISERIEIITNASLLTKETTLALVDAGLDTIRISLQGLSSKKYKEVCRYDIDFDEFIDNIRYFYKNKKQCNVFVKVLDTALEEGESEKFYNLFSDISDRMYIEKCRPVYDGVNYSENIFKTMDRYGRAHNKREVCPLPFFMLGVFPNGDVEPCDTIYKPIVLGNIHNDTLLNMWRGDKLREFQMLQLNKERNKNNRCAVCCAPDDVSHPEDELDQMAKDIIKRFK